MRKNPLRLLAAACALILAGTASAADITDSINLTVQVDPACRIFQAPGDVSMIHDSTGGNTAGDGNTVMSVICNNNLPFNLEVDTNMGAEVVLTDANTGKSVIATLKIDESGNGYNPAFWGSTANNMQFNGSGTGAYQVFSIDVNYGNGRMPAVGTYTNGSNVLLNF